MYWELTPILQKNLTTLVTSCRTAVSQNNSQCLLLNILRNATRDIFQYVRKENIKNEHARTKRKKIWGKVSQKEWAVLIFT